MSHSNTSQDPPKLVTLETPKDKVLPFDTLLLQNFASGKSSAVSCQATAQSAVAWREAKGGTITQDDFVCKVAALGCKGKFKSNMERDFHRLVRTCNRRLGADIETIPARMYNHATGEIEVRQLAVLHPDTLAEALYKKGSKVWRHCMFREVDALAFWRHAYERCAWFQRHPAASYPNWAKLIPLSLYGDEVQTYKGSEVGAVSVLAWSSDFAWGSDSMTRYFPICVWSEADSLDFTVQDIFHGIVPRLKAMFDQEELHGWSDQGYHFMLSSIQGDLKWVLECYGLYNFRSNYICALCGCQKSNQRVQLTVGDFRDEAEYWDEPGCLDGFHEKGCEVFRLPGATVDRVLHDVCHGQLLGTGKALNGALLVYLCERNMFGKMDGRGEYPIKLEGCLRSAHLSFVEWQKVNKCRCSQPRFTVARVCRRNRQSYPALQSKAVNGKTVTHWLASWWLCFLHGFRMFPIEIAFPILRSTRTHSRQECKSVAPV